MQDDSRSIVTKGLSYQEALKRSVEEGKLLVLVEKWVDPPQGRRAWWANPTLREWVASEAIVIEKDWSNVSPETRERILRSKPDWQLITGTRLFLDGKELSMDAALNLGKGRARVKWQGRVRPTATFMLYHMDLQMEMAAARDLPFAIRGQKRRADDARRGQEDPLSAIGSPGIDGVGDLPPDQPDPLVRLEEAREKIKTDPARAIGLLTWLWERGPVVEPAFAMLREPVLLPLLLEAGSVTQLARQRLCELAEVYPSDLDAAPESRIAARLLDAHTIEHGGGAAGIVEGLSRAMDQDEELLSGPVASRQTDVLFGIGLGQPLRRADDGFLDDVRRHLRATNSKRRGEERVPGFYVAVIAHETVRGFVAGLRDTGAGEVRAIAWANTQMEANASWPVADQTRLRRALALAALAQPKMSSELKAAARAWLADSGSPVPAWMNSRVAGAAGGPGLP